MNNPTAKVSYRLKKVTTHRRTCPACGGTKVLGNGSRCVDCNKGISEYTETTESDLIEALHTTGFIQWIKDNFQKTEKDGNKNG